MIGPPTGFWGKLKQEKQTVVSWHPLADHCADVAATCEALLRRYRAKPYAGKVTLFQATGEASGKRRPATRDWDELALGGVEVHEISGTHYSILHEPQVEDLAHRLRESGFAATQG